jgi:hypothetical protein
MIPFAPLSGRASDPGGGPGADGEGFMTEAAMPDSRKVFDLVDVLEEGEPRTAGSGGGQAPAGPLVIHDLTEVVQEVPLRALADPALREMVLQRVSEIAERLAREMIPPIAERIIREEIDKLKAADAP